MCWHATPAYCGDESVHVRSEAVYVLVYGLKAATMKLDHERCLIDSRDRVQEPENVYVYEYGVEGG